jgi:dTDP-4-amino-4,6-dideoxygalactose transaminase
MIPYFDYRPEYRRMQAEIDAAIERVLGSGQLILGAEVEGLERETAELIGVREAVGVNSGTDALILALRALDFGKGDEVITVNNAGVPPVAAIRAAGATPRFVDVDPRTLLLDPTALGQALGPRTRGLLAVHLYGQPAPMGPILRFASEHGLQVVEDCAQATGATYDGRPVGGLGVIGCFSFYPTKNVGAFGDGGLCATDDPGLAERLRMLRTYGFRAGDRHAHIEGLNSRLDELQAAVLRTKLQRLSETLAERRRLAGLYIDGLRGSAVQLPATGERGTHTYHLFVVRLRDRTRGLVSLQRAGIGYGIHYAEPVHLMEAYRFLGYREGQFPVSESACREVISLPLYPGLPDAAVKQTVQALVEASD